VTYCTQRPLIGPTSVAALCTRRRLPTTVAAVCAYSCELHHLLSNEGFATNTAYQYSLAVESALLIAIKHTMPQPIDSHIVVHRMITTEDCVIHITHLGRQDLLDARRWFSTHYLNQEDYPSPETIYARAVLDLTGTKPAYTTDGSLVRLTCLKQT